MNRDYFWLTEEQFGWLAGLLPRDSAASQELMTTASSAGLCTS